MLTPWQESYYQPRQRIKKQRYYCANNCPSSQGYGFSSSHVLENVHVRVGPDCLTCLLRNLYAGQEATEPDMQQQTGSKLGKIYIKAVYCHRDYLTYMQSTSCAMPGWMKHKLEKDCQENINNLRYADDTTLMAESEEEQKSLLMKMKEESEKTGLKLSIQK